MLKKFIFIVSLLFCSSLIFSQTMRVHKTDGTVHDFEVIEVDSITFYDSTSISFGLLGFYPFKGNADDLSGNGKHGTLIGNATVTTFLTIGNNNSDALSLPYTIADSLVDFTFSAMLKINNLHTSNSGSVPGNGWLSCTSPANWAGNALNFFYLPSQQQWQVSAYPPGTNQSSSNIAHFFSDNTIEDGNWHHIVFTRKENIIRLFIDGIKIVSDGVINNLPILVSPNGLIIGQEQDWVGGGYDLNQSWAGDVDNLRIYDRALTTQEIQIIYGIDGFNF